VTGECSEASGTKMKEVFGCGGKEDDGSGGLWWRTKMKEVVGCGGDEARLVDRVCIPIS